MPNYPNPSHRSLMTPGFFNRIKALALSPEAQILRSEGSDESFLAAALSYIGAAQKSGLPPEHWRVAMPKERGSLYQLCAPLMALRQHDAGGEFRAQAAAALSKAGASLWHSLWTIQHGNRYLYNHAFLSPASLAFQLAQGSDENQSPLREFLRMALTDPLTPPEFLLHLRARYNETVQELIPGAKGVLGPKDQAARRLCSLLCDCSCELLAASARDGWAGAADLASDAAATLALKDAPIAMTDPEALQRSLTEPQTARLKALCSLAMLSEPDDALITLGLNDAHWLRETPDLACLPVFNGGSLLSIALAWGNQTCLRWLDQAGANLWLAAAQYGQPNACEWALSQASVTGDDLAPVARMLLRGAWLSGDHEPKARCLDLLAQAIDARAPQAALPGSPGFTPDAMDKARSLMTQIEKIAMAEAIATNASPPLPAPAKRPGRSL